MNKQTNKRKQDLIEREKLFKLKMKTDIENLEKEKHKFQQKCIKLESTEEKTIRPQLNGLKELHERMLNEYKILVNEQKESKNCIQSLNNLRVKLQHQEKELKHRIKNFNLNEKNEASENTQFLKQTIEILQSKLEQHNDHTEDVTQIENRRVEQSLKREQLKNEELLEENRSIKITNNNLKLELEEEKHKSQDTETKIWELKSELERKSNQLILLTQQYESQTPEKRLVDESKDRDADERIEKIERIEKTLEEEQNNLEKIKEKLKNDKIEFDKQTKTQLKKYNSM
eukprot:UN28648